MQLIFFICFLCFILAIQNRFRLICDLKTFSILKVHNPTLAVSVQNFRNDPAFICKTAVIYKPYLYCIEILIIYFRWWWTGTSIKQASLIWFCFFYEMISPPSPILLILCRSDRGGNDLWGLELDILPSNPWPSLWGFQSTLSYSPIVCIFDFHCRNLLRVQSN
jgi:hypothetical protein